MPLYYNWAKQHKNLVNLIIRKGDDQVITAFSTSPGQMTGIIKTVHGYHIILAEEIIDYNIIEDDRAKADETLDF